MASLLRKKIIRKEINLFHYLMLTTGKLLVGMGIGTLIVQYAFPYSYPLIIIGALILIPSLYYLFRFEKKEEKTLKKKLRK